VKDQQQSRSRPTRKQLLWAGAAVALLSIAILIGYRYGIRLWDLIPLLIVPAAIAIGAGFENFERANLREADLEGADLGVANLTIAQGWTKDQLAAARSLEGATMPNGQMYEDWLKDRGSSLLAPVNV
jgi:hypothetical protein